MGVPVSLATKKWTEVSLHNVVLAWLRAERDGYVAQRFSQFPDRVWRPGLDALLDNANLNDAEENRSRLRVLYITRALFVIEIPPDTRWYEVQNLTHAEISELRTVNFPAWNFNQNELGDVAAAREDVTLNVEPSNWERPILWGHDQKGPFTIIEGNTRLTAYKRSERTDLDVPVFVGLSKLKCFYHRPDNATTLIRDLFGQRT